MHRYRAYGLDISSELRLPELVAVGDDEDFEASVEILQGEVAHLAESTQPYGDRIISEQQYLIWNLIGHILVCDGRKIVAQPARKIDEGLLRMMLLGRCTGALLNQRGRLVLHASSVVVETASGAPRVVAFVGFSGAGKSTLASALYADGGAAVAGDDLLPVLASDSEAPMVDTGFPALKLEAEAALALGIVDEALPLLHPEIPERYYAMSRGFTRGPLPLGAIYVIERGEDNAIVPLTRQQGCVELLRYSFAVDLLTEQEARRRHFVSCAAVADQVPVRRLQTGSTIAALAAVPEMIRADRADENLLDRS